MSLKSVLTLLKFYVVDKSQEPEQIFEFDSRGQAVTFGYARNNNCRHSRRYDHAYVIPKSKGKQKVR